MPIISYGETHIGQKRSSNQDSIYVGDQDLLYVVADGMGGHNGGDTASQLAVSVVPKTLKETKTEPAEALAQSIQDANLAIFNKAKEEPQLKGMGTTVVSLLFQNSNLYVGNVGDSRAYLIHKDHLFQLSKDHSLVQEKVNLGIYSREDGKKDKMKNVLVRTVGYEDEVEVDTFTYKVCRNDLFLICSDGLYGLVSEPRILEIIKEEIPDMSQATKSQLEIITKRLIHEANQNGGDDNISVIMTLAQ